MAMRVGGNAGEWQRRRLVKYEGGVAQVGECSGLHVLKEAEALLAGKVTGKVTGKALGLITESVMPAMCNGTKPFGSAL